jgi:hypothetical protein
MGCSSSPESSLRLAAADVLYEAHAYRAALDAFRAAVDSLSKSRPLTYKSYCRLSFEEPSTQQPEPPTFSYRID